MLPLQFDELLAAGAMTPETTAAVDSLSTNLSNDIKSLEGLSFDVLIQKLVNGMVDFAFHLAIAIVVFYLGKFIISKIYKIVDTIFIRRQLDRSLSSFILSMVRIVLYFILIVTVVGILGIETSSFLALFASAGVAIGLALSGTLQNFAGGVLILLLKPYKVGDYIEAQGYSGTVKEIQIFSTIINTSDNKQIIIPNGPLSTGSINNYSKEGFRRVEWTVSIAYGDDVSVARKAILEMLLSDDRVVKQFIEDHQPEHQAELREEEQRNEDADDAADADRASHSWWWRLWHKKKKHVAIMSIEERNARLRAQLPKVDRSPMVALGTLNSSSVDLTVRAWVASGDYWGVYFDMNERFYRELPEHGINFPFPQLDVHLAGQD